MELELLLDKIKLPIKYYNNDFDIKKKFEDEANRFIFYLNLVDGIEFDEDKAEQVKEMVKKVIPRVENVKSKISDIFQYNENANPGKAQESLDNIMKDIKDQLFISTIDDWIHIQYPKNSYTRIRTGGVRNFYRVRAVKQENATIENDANELFHIPMNKKAYSNNDRFSLAGFPSLYIATSLSLAWLESGCPVSYYYSEFDYLKINSVENQFNFLSLYSPNEIKNWGVAEKYNDFELWLEIVRRYLEQYLLIMACSFVNHGGSVIYKQEYLLPQMLMQWVQRENTYVQGISYFSCVDMTLMRRGYCAYNIAIPAIAPFYDNRISKRLSDSFNWSMPKYYKIPLLDLEQNAEDRKHLYEMIEKIQNFCRKYWLPNIVDDYISEIYECCALVYQLMNNKECVKIQIIIQALELVSSNLNMMKKRKNIEFTKSDCMKPDESVGINKVLNDINNDIFEDANGLYAMVRKYIATLFNDFVCGTYIEIRYRKGEDICPIKNILKDKHLLYFEKIIESEDEIIGEKKAKDIETPLVKIVCDESIYDISGETKKYWQENFKIEEHLDDLIKLLA